MDEPLRTRLEKLQSELADAQAGDADMKVRVEDIQRDVQAALEQPTSPEAHLSLFERLRNAVPQFESTHPRITLAINEVVDELSRMSL